MVRYFLLGLQVFQVAILLLHDWVPVPPLNDIRAARQGHTVRTMALGTLVSSLLPCVGLTFSLIDWNSGWPRWLFFYLVGAYAFLFVGELEAWWVPYFFRPQPKRAAEYDAMYRNTYAFLPSRNGIRINALHFVLHAATVTTLALLAVHFATRLQ